MAAKPTRACQLESGVPTTRLKTWCSLHTHIVRSPVTHKRTLPSNQDVSLPGHVQSTDLISQA
jgi:hypothetical protein